MFMLQSFLLGFLEVFSSDPIPMGFTVTSWPVYRSCLLLQTMMMLISISMTLSYLCQVPCNLQLSFYLLSLTNAVCHAMLLALQIHTFNVHLQLPIATCTCTCICTMYMYCLCRQFASLRLAQRYPASS